MRFDRPSVRSRRCSSCRAFVAFSAASSALGCGSSRSRLRLACLTGSASTVRLASSFRARSGLGQRLGDLLYGLHLFFALDAGPVDLFVGLAFRFFGRVFLDFSITIRSISSSSSKKSETYRNASRSSPIATKADCIPGSTRITRPL